MTGSIGTISIFLALLDMGMNGSRYARYAPWWICIGIVCAVVGEATS
jgi:hypothetical protein